MDKRPINPCSNCGSTNFSPGEKTHILLSSDQEGKPATAMSGANVQSYVCQGCNNLLLFYVE